ncbi:MAG: capsule assembly Wzi family protein [Spirosomataceae bacterium]
MKTIRFLLYCFLSVYLLVTTAFSQDSTASQSFKGELSADVYSTNAQMPFWFRANQYDVIPQKTAVSISGKIDYETHLSAANPKWKFVGSSQIVGNIGDTRPHQLYLPQLYAGIRFGPLLFYAGRKKELFGLADSTLGSGSYIWSGNALPIPKIQIEISDYLPIGKKNPWLAFKGNYAHGWFGASKFAYGYFLHQKSLYLRLGRKSSMVKLIGGFNHQVTWGGKTTVEIGTVTNQSFPSAFGDYMEVVIAFGANIGLKRRGTNNFDSTNRVGNHLGTLDAGMEFDFKKYNLLFYRQNIYEDGSLFYLTSLSDGLNGMVLTNLFPNREKGKLSFRKAVFEILNTRSQGGTVFVIADNKLRGKDDYFNHQQYYDGWSYRRRIIGTPFITNQEDTNRPEIQNSNDMANNNRVLVFHLGFEGYFGPNIYFLSKLSYSANYGTYNYPYETIPKQFSGLLQLKGQISALPGFEWTAAIANDNGALYTKNLGFRLGVRKVWGTGRFKPDLLK